MFGTPALGEDIILYSFGSRNSELIIFFLQSCVLEGCLLIETLFTFKSLRLLLKRKRKVETRKFVMDNILVSLLALKIKWEQVVWQMSTRYKSPLCTWYLEVSVYGEPEGLTIPLIMKLTILFFIFLYMLPASWWKRIRNLACSTRLVLIPPQSKWCLLVLCTYDAVKKKHEEQLLQITLVCFWCW